MSVFIGYPSFMAYQMMKGKKGNNDGFPSIPGMIARYSAKGLTNEEMSKNPVWKDLMGNGHDLQMKNFAWKGMSGVGGYGDENYQTFYKFTLDDYVFIASPPGVKHMNFTFRVTRLQPGNKLTLAFFGTTNTVYGTWDKDGIYTVDADIVEAGKPTYFYNGYGATRGEFTIEILPLYPGALVFDGVDDYGTCDNFPILTKEKGYTVVALRQYLVEKSTAYLTANGDSISNTSFIFEGNNYKDTCNFGKATGIQASRILATQTSKQYDGVKLNIGTNAEGSNLLQVGKWSKSYSNVAIWELVFLDHDATEEELNKIKDYFVKTYPWLFPDQAWTVVGKTNEDEDRATIANITGNGNDLVLSNFGFAEESGYNEEGEYAGYLVTDGVDDKVVSKQFKFGENFTVILDFKFPVKKISYCGFDLSAKVRIQNLQDSGVYVVLKGNKTLIPSNVVRAVTSEGKVYDENWNEYNIVPGNISSNYTMVNLGFDGSIQFAESATKLAGIYSSTLSKDECIKAYNYLQTLKAK